MVGEPIIASPSTARQLLQHYNTACRGLERAGSGGAGPSTYFRTISKPGSVITLWRLPSTYLDKTFSLFLTPSEESHHRTE